jgi:hypothetical protein
MGNPRFAPTRKEIPGERNEALDRKTDEEESPAEEQEGDEDCRNRPPGP